MPQPDRPYNYARFKARYYQFDGFDGPQAGNPFPPFALTDQDGQAITAAQLQGRWSVIESGSVTCPQYIANIPKMLRLCDQFPDVSFVVLYVREAHPGGAITAHRDLDDKRRRARAAAAYGERRTLIIDDLRGSLHRAIGSRPNLVYILNPAGTVVFRSDWNVPERVEEVLNARDPSRLWEGDHHAPILAPPLQALRVVASAGAAALFDLAVGLPHIAWLHLRGRL